MFSTPTLIALAKIACCFVLILFGISRKWGLWPSILLGAAAMGMLFGLSLPETATVMARTFTDQRLLSMLAIIAGILLLSEVQESTGQGKRLVSGLESYMRSTELRLVFFPALIGLLPMPGGAIFSCPMVRDTAADTTLSDEQKGLINYWFRHIWEIAWPLYPGYLLACNLSGIPFSRLWHYTFPVVGISLLVGWLYYLRGKVHVVPGKERRSRPDRSLSAVLLEGLPILVALAGAPLVGLIAAMGGYDMPTEMLFVVSLFAAVATGLIQTGTSPAVLPKLFFTRHMARMLLIIYAIFAFKDVIGAADVVRSLAGFAESKLALAGLFLFLPIVTGLLTGLMAGFVGAAFPLLISLLVQMDLQDERLTWLMMALVAGNLGQMLSPLHTCFVVTTEYFHVPFATMWRRVAVPAITQCGLALTYVFLLHVFGAKL